MDFSFASLLIGLIIGAIAGIIGGLLWQRSQPQAKAARQVTREHEQLKNQVADHFVETAQLVNQLTDSYKDVMDHLRTGAITLVDRQTLENRLPHSDSETVTVMRISSSDPSPAPGAAKPVSQASTDDTSPDRQHPPSSPGSSHSADTDSTTKASAPDQPNPAPRGWNTDKPASTRPLDAKAGDTPKM